MIGRSFRVPAALVALLLAAWLVMRGMVDDLGRLADGGANLRVFVKESLFPPDWSVLQPRSYPECGVDAPWLGFTCSTAWIGMLETLKIAFVSTVLGMFISMPLALLSNRNQNPDWIALPVRLMLAGARTLPSIIWAILFVILIGLGPLAGILAMTVYTVGYLGKLQYEAMEGVARPPLEAMHAMGASWFERSFAVVLPETANALISQAIFMFEYNVRHGTVIGIVGAGGIGYYINLYLRFLQYDKVVAYLIIIFVVVALLDLASIRARRLFTERDDVRHPRWWTVLVPSSMLRGASSPSSGSEE